MQYVGFDGVLSVIWRALSWCVEWVQLHGIHVTVNQHVYTISFFTIFVSLFLIKLVVNYLPVWGDQYDDEYDD